MTARTPPRGFATSPAAAGSGGCDSLTGRLADIDSDIETLNGRIARNDAAPHLVQQLMHRIAFPAADIKIAGYVPPRQDQRMQGGDRRRIAHGKGKRVGTHKLGLGERTE